MIDIATELAEGFDIPPFGIPLEDLKAITLPGSGARFHKRHSMSRADEKILNIISSAHLACGLHSGDPLLIRRTAAKLIDRGITIGAHPSYPDTFNFGQKRVEMSKDELVSTLLYQFGALDGVLKAFGQRIHHIKCHGALNFDVADEEFACEAMIDAVQAYNPALHVLMPSGSRNIDRMKQAGLSVVEEAYADRGYGKDGRILPRDHAHALLESPESAAQQVVSIARDGLVPVYDGTLVPINARSICLHSDTPGVAEFVKSILAALDRENITIAPL